MEQTGFIDLQCSDGLKIKICKIIGILGGWETCLKLYQQTIANPKTGHIIYILKKLLRKIK